jgi:hypothetical protein
MVEYITEAQVKKAYRKILREKGAYVFAPVQMGYGRTTLDDLVCYRGRFIGIEAKRPGLAPTKAQDLTMVAITLAGGIAVCITHPDQVVELLAMIDLGLKPPVRA